MTLYVKGDREIRENYRCYQTVCIIHRAVGGVNRRRDAEALPTTSNPLTFALVSRTSAGLPLVLSIRVRRRPSRPDKEL